MTNYIYRQRYAYVTIVERVELPEGLSAQEAFDNHRPTYGTDNDLAFSHYANGQDVEIVSVETEGDEEDDYAVWYSDQDGNDTEAIDPMFETWYQEKLKEE
jgi:hypothetical protein